jgi:hypothetical protein
MRSTREILQSVVSASPKITIDAVQANGDVAFHVAMKDCSLTKEDCCNPITKTAFFVNFMGELLVRENIQKFAVILVGLDSVLHKKLVCSSSHFDFGMVIDHKWSTMTFQMHLSLVQEIMTEGQRGDYPSEGGGPSVADMFDQSKPDEPRPEDPDDTEEKQ